jgi:hypothetical protein
MKFSHLLIAIYTTVFCAIGFAQTQGYVGEQHREIKSLSPREITHIQTGKGMGFAMPAELNQYPGPMHVLAYAHALELNETQIAASLALIALMRTEALNAGERYITAECGPDALFCMRNASPAALADIRASHFRTHIAQRDFLTPAQIARYDEMRSYVMTSVAPELKAN